MEKEEGDMPTRGGGALPEVWWGGIGEPTLFLLLANVTFEPPNAPDKFSRWLLFGSFGVGEVGWLGPVFTQGACGEPAFRQVWLTTKPIVC